MPGERERFSTSAGTLAWSIFAGFDLDEKHLKKRGKMGWLRLLS
jgi:hypothetical protein